VNTADDARKVVAASKFPPQGVRGQGSAFPSIAYGTDLTTYLNTANENTIICVQIETKAGVDNVDAICQVPGVGRWCFRAAGDGIEV
jgi:4-hydroxy-2-oxoheptanedioate aldolase